MTRSWTDPRTGKRWHIDVVREPGGRAPAPKGAAPDASSALVFDGREGSFSLPTEEATRLEALEDEKLAELLDLAKSASSPQPDVKDSEQHATEEERTRARGNGGSRSAAGRESQPHRNHGKHRRPAEE